MSKSKTSNLPIGFWLKKVDQLLTDQINRIQVKNSLSRLEWQTLNTLFGRDDASKEALYADLTPFTDGATLGNILVRFRQLHWIDVYNGDEGSIMYHLTSEGKLQHQRVFQAQQAVRVLTMKNVTANDYAIVIKTLQQMAANLEMAESLTDNEPAYSRRGRRTEDQ